MMMEIPIGDSIDEFYCEETLGKGAFAHVYKAIHIPTGMEFAVKKIDLRLMKEKNMIRRIKHEVEIHKQLNHPSIVRLYKCLEDDNYMYLILEICEHGDLQRYLDSRKAPLSETEARDIFQQIVEGIIHLHSYSVIHRDLKPSNILVTSNRNIKIADFGMAIQLSQPDEKHMTMCGTPNYISPEIVTRRTHGLETDFWSLGCLLYTLLVGKPPFDTKAVPSTFDRVVTVDYKLPYKLSFEAKNLIQLLLQKKPEKRIKSNDILTHPFMTGKTSYLERGKNKGLFQRCVDSDMDTLTTLSTKMSGNSDQFIKSQPMLGMRMPSLDTVNSSGTSSLNSYGGKKNVKIYRSASPPVQRHPSPQYGPTIQHDVIYQRNKVSSQSANDIYKLYNKYDDNAKEIRSRSLCSRGSDCSDERRKIGNVVENRKLSGEVNRKLHGNSLEDVRNCPGHNRPSFQIGHGNSNQISSVKCDKCNLDPCPLSTINKSTSNCNCSNEFHYSCNKSRPAEIDNEKHRHFSQGCCEKIEKCGGRMCTCSSICCESQHCINNHKPIERSNNNHSHLQQLVQCSHHQFCNPESVHCSHTDFCYCRQKISTDGQSSVHRSNSYVQANKNVNSLKEERICDNRINVQKKQKEGDCDLPLSSPFSSKRLRPIRQRTKNAMVNILPNGEVCLEFLKNNGAQDRVVDVCRISPDGLKIIIYKPRGRQGVPLSDKPPPLPPKDANVSSIYAYNGLPKQHWKKYIYAARFVNLVRAKTPKITFYSPCAKCILMENSPNADIEVSFYAGGKITRSGESIKIINSNGRIYTIQSENEIASLGPSVVEMWNHFLKCDEYCRHMEKTIHMVESVTEFASFPIIIGKKPLVNTNVLKQSNKDNIPHHTSPITDSFKTSIMTSFNTTASTQSPPMYNLSNINKKELPLLKEKASVSGHGCNSELSKKVPQYRLESRNSNLERGNKENFPYSLNRDIPSSHCSSTKTFPSSMHIPDVGWVYRTADKKLYINYEDGSQICFPESFQTLTYTDKAGNAKQYSPREVPSYIAEKVKQVPAIIQKMGNSASSVR